MAHGLSVFPPTSLDASRLDTYRYGRYETTPGTCSKVNCFRVGVLEHSVRVKKKELRPKKLFHVPCPARGATAGGRCGELHSGAPRSEPHLERMLAAIETEELTRIHVVRDVGDSASQQ